MSRVQAIVVALSILSAVPPAGRPLAAGRVAILGGAVERTLRNGVDITLEGPGEFELRGELSAFLHAVSAVVRMPEGVSRAREPVTIDGQLTDWRLTPGFMTSRDGTDSCPEWVDGRMMYDDGHLYIAAHVGDPLPMQSSIDPAVDPDLGWRGGSVQVRVSTDRQMGWPVSGNSAGYYSQRNIVPTDEEKALAGNPRFAHLTMWFHAASQTPCLTIRRGMLVGELEVNPSAGQAGGYRGAFSRDADGKGYILEYAIPWRLLNCDDDPPRAGDALAAVWQVHDG